MNIIWFIARRFMWVGINTLKRSKSPQWMTDTIKGACKINRNVHRLRVSLARPSTLVNISFEFVRRVTRDLFFIINIVIVLFCCSITIHRFIRPYDIARSLATCGTRMIHLTVINGSLFEHKVIKNASAPKRCAVRHWKSSWVLPTEGHTVL